MKYRVHRHMAEEIRRRCENRLPIRLNAWWFSLGNIYPDCSHQRIFHMHEPDSAGLMVERMIRRNCRWGLGKKAAKKEMLSRWCSWRLGIICHYVCDFMCYVHTSHFEGNLREHRVYEAVQGMCAVGDEAPAQSRPYFDGSFYQAGSGKELSLLLRRALKERDADSYSPAADLSFGVEAAAELVISMLRISMSREETASWWNHLPLIRIRYLATGIF